MNDALKNRLDACRINISIALTAPAGSGKTTVLIARILTLVAFGEDINSIIAITYTDNAATGIKERIIKVAKQIYKDYAALSDDGKRDRFISLKLIFFNSFIKSPADRADAGVKKELNDFIAANFVSSNEAETNDCDLSESLLLNPAEIYSAVLNNLSNINISTFHGFFYKIINLFPIESGLLPGFGIIDDNESTIIKRNLINEFFLTHLVSSEKNSMGSIGDLEKKLIDFFYVFNDNIVNSQRAVDLILNSVLEKFDLVIYSVSLFAGRFKPGSDYTDIFDYNISQILDSGVVEYLFMPEGDIPAKFNAIKDGLYNFENLISDSFNFLFENYNSKNLLDLLARIIDESKNKAVKKSVELLKRNIEYMVTGEDAGHRCYDIRFLMNFYKSIKEGYKRIHEFMNLKRTCLTLTDKEKGLINLLYSAFIDFYEKANFLNYIGFTIIIFKIIREYENIKKSRNVIDFPGIEFKALSLLYFADFQYVEEKLNYKIKHLIIDEFQDANRIEFELIKKLMDERLSGFGMSGESRIKGTIFFVGDPNQSVYGFRSSDYKIFNEAISYFRSKVVENFDIKAITMEENFRSTEKLIEFQNIIFSDSYFKCLNNSAANVVCGKKDLPDKNAFDFYPVVLKLYKSSRKKNDGDKNTDSEESSVAYEIKRILDAGQSNDLSLASHIKIVSRKHRGRGWDNLKNALADRHIPFKIYGDKGFYQKKEIDTVMSILKFFINSKDELSLCKILKSMSDTECNKKVPLETLKSVKKGFRELNAADEDDKINISSPFFILKKIYNIFNINVLYSKDTQAVANLKKLLSIAQNYDMSTVYEFLSDVQERVNSGYKETEEEVIARADETEEGKVSLMTIHGAKGLENDIVFIYGTPLNSLHNRNGDIKYKFDIIFERDRPEFILLNEKPTDNPLCASSVSEDDPENITVTDILDKKREKETVKEENEFKRLLYVALTRSKFLCYITDEIKDDNKKDKHSKNVVKIGDGLSVNAVEPGNISWSDIISGQTILNSGNMSLVLLMDSEKDKQEERRFEKIVSFIKNINILSQNARNDLSNGRLVFDYKDIINRHLDTGNVFKSEFNIKNPSLLRGGGTSGNTETSKEEDGLSEKTLDMETAPVIRGLLMHKILEIIGKFNHYANLDADKNADMHYMGYIIKMDSLKFLIKNVFLDNPGKLRDLQVDFEKQIGVLFEGIDKLKINKFINEGYNEVQYLKSVNIKFNGYFKGNVISGRIDKVVLKEIPMPDPGRKNKNTKINVDIYDYKTGSLKSFTGGLNQLGFYADAVKDVFGDENILELKKYYYFIDEDRLSLV